MRDVCLDQASSEGSFVLLGMFGAVWLGREVGGHGNAPLSLGFSCSEAEGSRRCSCDCPEGTLQMGRPPCLELLPSTCLCWVSSFCLLLELLLSPSLPPPGAIAVCPRVWGVLTQRSELSVLLPCPILDISPVSSWKSNGEQLELPRCV